ncbi:MAG: CocE/NonD family hydrolase, partial [Actinomycetota bacterium]|nr:CocE/NonD family hydrolase [Actinomycetota bacterium]
MSFEQRLPGFPDLVMERDVPARMRDGTTLYADVYRPSRGGPFPVILMRLPYDKTQAESITYRHPSWYARHGYVVVVQDTRGRWSSEGDFYPFANEAEDGYDSVEWAASLPHSNGRVGMCGFSYVGATQLQAAIERPPSLQTICPGLTGPQYYDGWAYNGGAFALAFNASWATNLAFDDARRRGDDAATQSLLAAFL